MNSVDDVIMYCLYLNNIKLLDGTVKSLNNFLVFGNTLCEFYIDIIYNAK